MLGSGKCGYAKLNIISSVFESSSRGMSVVGSSSHFTALGGKPEEVNSRLNDLTLKTIPSLERNAISPSKTRSNISCISSWRNQTHTSFTFTFNVRAFEGHV